MSSVELDRIAAGIRDVTDDEVQHYRENGWVALERLVDPAIIEAILERVKARMGEDAQRTKDRRAGLKNAAVNSLWQYYEGLSDEDEFVQEFSHSRALARVAARLIGRPVHFYSDEVMCKLPAAVGGGKTPWHSDYPYHPFDRRGVNTLWFPLVDCPPEMGSMRFLSGSHDSGPWGRFVTREDGVDTLDFFPELRDRFPISPPLHLHVGDATVHDRNIIHMAPPNETDTPRWVYGQGYFPHDALYNGAPNRRMDGLGLEVNKPIDHPKFPLIDTD